MTTIVWDGTSIVADTLVNSNGLKTTMHKLLLLTNGAVAGFVGGIDGGLNFLEWCRAGKNKNEWPAILAPGVATGDTGVLGIYLSACKFPHEYEFSPIPFLVQEPKMAWGSGRTYALAAMECGKSAAEALLIAAKFDLYTNSFYTGFRWDGTRFVPIEKNKQSKSAPATAPVLDVDFTAIDTSHEVWR